MCEAEAEQDLFVRTVILDFCYLVRSGICLLICFCFFP